MLSLQFLICVFTCIYISLSCHYVLNPFCSRNLLYFWLLLFLAHIKRPLMYSPNYKLPQDIQEPMEMTGSRIEGKKIVKVLLVMGHCKFPSFIWSRCFSIIFTNCFTYPFYATKNHHIMNSNDNLPRLSHANIYVRFLFLSCFRMLLELQD